MSEPELTPAPTTAARSGWLPLIATAVVLSLVAAAIGWWLGRRVATPAEDGAHPAILTEFALPSLDGETLGPRDYRGRVLLVDFWATWCGPCHIQARILERLHEEYAERGVDFLAVSVGEEAQTVRRFVEERPFPYPVLYDEGGRLMTEGQVWALPTLMVIDRQGRIAFLRAGVTSGTRLRVVLDGVLDGGGASTGAG